MYREQLVVMNEHAILWSNLQQHNIKLIHGAASLEDAHTVKITKPDCEAEISGDAILIATGSSPWHPPQIPFDGRLIYDSDSILHMQRIPKNMAVIGGGVIGSEYASIFTALGVQVTLVDPKDCILPFIDNEISLRLRDQLKSLGLKFDLGRRVTTIEPQENCVRFTLDNGATSEVDIILVAMGRQSNIQGLGLEQIGVQLGDRGVILVNDRYQTSVPSIYAAGDVIGFPALASTSMEQARVAVAHAFNLTSKEEMSPVVPLAVYAIPEISMVGLTEEQCIAKQIPYLVGRGFYARNPRGQIIGDMSGMIKLIFSPEDKKLLGTHIIGEQASELIHLAAHVLEAEGTIDTFIRSVYNYPTLSDLYKYAAYDGLGNWEKWKMDQKVLDESGNP